MENGKSIELPFGIAFKHKWLEYVQFMDSINRNTSVNLQNHALSFIKESCDTETDALRIIDEYKIVSNKLWVK